MNSNLPHSTEGKQGVALVLVLAFLVLVSGLIVAFFSGVTTELSDAKGYAGGVTAKQLGDSAVSAVIGTIRSATADPKLSWASQPGMIRTYDENGARVSCYKLYSSDTMVADASGTAFDPATDLDPNWQVKRSLYADLNAPQMVPDQNNPQNTRPAFPILDPRGLTKIEGFDYKAEIPGVVLPANDPNEARLPMPVRWIYVLRDGTMTVPDTGDATGAVWSGTATPPTASNPIIGRIAFWTDDESSKVNINTASEGTFWDKPYTSAWEDSNFTNSIPAQNEFQRTPGHPATTCLSTVLGSVLPRPAAVAGGSASNPFTGPFSAAEAAKFASFYDIAPRVKTGGTAGGTVAATTSSIITPDSDRLYASVDELLFRPNLPGQPRTNYPALNRELIEQSRFFLTASSRAPDVNLFGRPRISLWPQQVNTAIRNVKDKLLAFASTFNNRPYYFQRLTTCQSGLAPFTVSSVPGSSQNATDDWTISRNQDLYRFLQEMTSNNVPGFGGKLGGNGGKYSNTRDQILTEMVDLVRSGVNANYVKSATTLSAEDYNYAVPITVGAPSWANGAPGTCNVVPLMPPPGQVGAGTKGFGTAFTVSEVCLSLTAEGYDVKTAYNAAVPDTVPTKLGALFSLVLFTPFNSPPAIPNTARIVVEGLDKFQVNGQSLNMPATATNVIGWWSHGGGQNFVTGHCLRNPMANASKSFGTGSPISQYPFFSTTRLPYPVPYTGSGTLSFRGGTITIKIYPAYVKSGGIEGTSLGGAPGPAETPIQTITVDFAKNAVTWPLPKRPAAAVTDGSTGPMFDKAASNAGRLRGIPAMNQEFVDSRNDVSRSMQINPDPASPSRGDLRLVTGLTTVGPNYFRENSNFNSSTAMYASSLRHQNKPLATGAGKSTIGPNSLAANIQRDASAAVPLGTTSASVVMNNGAPGDWSSGIGNYSDGPMINTLGLGNSAVVGAGFFSNPNVTVTAVDYSPSRQVPSPLIFGSLPTGIDPNGVAMEPWCTLLFCKNPAAGNQHPGFGTSAGGSMYSVPPDHLFLDLFTMPVVEPYPISEPFSTAGKINLNYQIAPFNYITRNTGLLALMKSVKVTVIPATMASGFKVDLNNSPSAATPGQLRYDINGKETLKGFELRFADKDIFRSASEICSVYLVPKDAPGNPQYPTTLTSNTMDNWWATNGILTGDNAREAPYSAIYARTTTKSNIYRVHVRAQALKQIPTRSASEWITWKEGRDQILGEYQASALVERYIEPDSAGLASLDFATLPVNDTRGNVDQYYKFRVLSTSRFAP